MGKKTEVSPLALFLLYMGSFHMDRLIQLEVIYLSATPPLI